MLLLLLLLLLTPEPSPPTTATVTGGCRDVRGTFIPEGGTFKPDACSTCTCREGALQCATVDCAPPPCKFPIIAKGVCCPVCPGEFSLIRALAEEEPFLFGLSLSLHLVSFLREEVHF